MPASKSRPSRCSARGILKSELDGVKILGSGAPGETLPAGLRFRDVLFSKSAREALEAAGAIISDGAKE